MHKRVTYCILKNNTIEPMGGSSLLFTTLWPLTTYKIYICISMYNVQVPPTQDGHCKSRLDPCFLSSFTLCESFDSFLSLTFL